MCEGVVCGQVVCEGVVCEQVVCGQQVVVEEEVGGGGGRRAEEGQRRRRECRTKNKNPTQRRREKENTLIGYPNIYCMPFLMAINHRSFGLSNFQIMRCRVFFLLLWMQEAPLPVGNYRGSYEIV